jgi:DNA-binding transcriptional LysR family regulator
MEQAIAASQKMLLDLKSLKLFVRVVEEGTIAAAAAHEHIAPAAVSRRLSEMEAELQMKLFLRSNKGLMPTAAALNLVHLAHSVLHDVENLYAEMQDYTEGVKGYVRILANLPTITQFLPTDLRAFLAKHLHIQIDLEERTSSAITKGVSENIADIGLFTVGVPTPNLTIFPYRKDKLVLVIPEQHPLSSRRTVSMKDILDFDFVALPSGCSISRQLRRAAADAGRTIRSRIQVTGFDTLCLMVEAGHGIGILPKDAAKPYLRALRVKTIPLIEPWAHRDLAICVRSYENLSAAAKLLVDHLRRPE